MRNEYLKKSNLPLLITGASGTGKTTFAKDLAKGSSVFLHLNVATLNKNLFESELFGHCKGAFTGASVEKIGFCERVADGTLFLDEIGELSNEQQAKILTLIDEKIFYPVGSSKSKIFRGRMIFATHRNLKKMVENGEFRADLYYRLRYLVVKMPCINQLKNKRQIIQSSINNLQAKFDKSLIFESEAMEALLSYHWPGNFRELIQTLEFIFLTVCERVTLSTLPEWVKVSQNDEQIGSIIFNYKEALEQFERRYFEALMQKKSGKINASANFAGISKVTLISKLKKYDINRLTFRENAKNIAG